MNQEKIENLLSRLQFRAAHFVAAEKDRERVKPDQHKNCSCVACVRWQKQDRPRVTGGRKASYLDPKLGEGTFDYRAGMTVNMEKYLGYLG